MGVEVDVVLGWLVLEGVHDGGNDTWHLQSFVLGRNASCVSQNSTHATLRFVSWEPRSDARAILDATRELLAECGVQGLTMEGVAARAGVAKTTVYRRWRSKDDLALAVLIDMVEHVVATPDLGDTRSELVAFVDAAVRFSARR